MRRFINGFWECLTPSRMAAVGNKYWQRGDIEPLCLVGEDPVALEAERWE